MLGVEDGSGEVLDEPLEPPEVLPGGQVVELLLQLVNLALEVRHLETEVALVTRPLAVANQKSLFRSRDLPRPIRGQYYL